MAQAVVATGPGGPEVLSLVGVDLEDPGPGQVRVEVRAAGVNPIDYKRYHGPQASPSDFPMRLGFEAAGVVTAVGDDPGDGTDSPRVGDEVIVYPVSGAYATELVAPLTSVSPKPSELTWEQAAGLSLAGATAVHALTVAKVEKGDILLVHGAAGGVGLMVTQLALAAGARVIGTASEARHHQLKALGAEPVVYGPGLGERLRTLVPQGASAAVDTVGSSEALESSLELVADRDRIVTIVAFQQAIELGIKSIGFGPGADPGTEVRSAARAQLARDAAAGWVNVLVAATFPLSETAAAHRLLAEGHSGGKIILVP